MTATLASALPSSSITSAHVTASAPRPPYVLGDRDAADPELAQLLHDVERELLVLVALAGARRDLLGGELPDEVADLLLLGRELEFHARREYRLPVTGPHARRWGR